MRYLAIVDTNVLIYDFVSNSPFHEEARKKLESLEALVVLPNILVEFILVSILKLKINEEIVRKKVEEILRQSVIVRVRKRDFVEALNLNVKDINDALLVSVAKRLNLPVMSYDSDVKELCEKVGVKIV
ncbi:PIN domain-containing protein [Sulfurisphaera javensis]|uniref:Ribonuclease VapC n=1 Tax=Sulfurisphaera javensis TaxID=2049879 RepID=A0AAT9GTD9_9CREN